MQAEKSKVSELRIAIARLVRQFRKQSNIKPFSQSELNVIGYLAQYGSLLPSELAEKEGISAQAISQILNNLLERNCIIKTPSVDDKRKTSITLSPKGLESLEVLRHQRVAWLAQAIEHTLTTDEAELLYQAIPALIKIAGYNEG